MKDVSQLTVLIVDIGIFSDLARIMAKQCKRVLFHVPNSEPWPKMNSSMINHGMPDIEVVDDIFGDHFEYVDLFMFPECGFGKLQSYLVSQGKKVWGARQGEDLELDRPYCKEIQKDLGLKVGDYQVITGFDNLKSYLKSHKEVYVKVSKYRGTCESFHCPDYKTIEPKLDEIGFKLGPLKSIMEFNVEAGLPDRVEVGSDSYCVMGSLPAHHMVGIEIKDAGYAGCRMAHDKINIHLREVDDKMAETMGEYEYCGPYSTEVRINKQDGILIDFTARSANPGGLICYSLWKNFPQIAWSGANGDLVEAEQEFPWGVQVMLKSEWSGEGYWQPIDFPEKFRDNVMISNGCKIANQYYYAPIDMGLTECGSVLGWGKTLDEAIRMASDIAKEVGGYCIKCNTGALSEAKEEISKAQKMGVDITPS